MSGIVLLHSINVQPGLSEVKYIILIYIKENPVRALHMQVGGVPAGCLLSGFIFNREGAGVSIFSTQVPSVLPAAVGPNAAGLSGMSENWGE